MILAVNPEWKAWNENGRIGDKPSTHIMIPHRWNHSSLWRIGGAGATEYQFRNGAPLLAMTGRV